MDIACPFCRKKYEISPDKAGQPVRCTELNCQQIFSIPALGPVFPPPKTKPSELIVRLGCLPPTQHAEDAFPALDSVGQGQQPVPINAQ